MTHLGRGAATAALALLSTIAACSSPNHRPAADGSGTASSGTGSAPPDSQPPKDIPVGKFDDALQAFRAAVAAQYSVDPASLQIIPGSEDVVGIDDQKVPGLIPFQVNIDRKPVRGWANGGGEVVLAKTENWGPVLRNAGALDDPPGMTALE